MQSNESNFDLFEINYYYDQHQQQQQHQQQNASNNYRSSEVIGNDPNGNQSAIYEEPNQLFGHYETHDTYGLVDDEPIDQHPSLLQSCLPELDIVSDAKTYGLMLPPSYHHQQQFAMSTLYANPFSYNLHTIIEESENESSLQTLSSLTSSTLQSSFEPYDNNGTSTTTTTTNSSNDNQMDQPEMLFSIVHNNSSPTVTTTNMLCSNPIDESSLKMYTIGDYDVDDDADSQSAVSELSFNPMNDDDDDHTGGGGGLHNGQQPWTGDPLERYFTSSLLQCNDTSVSSKVSNRIVTMNIDTDETTLQIRQHHHSNDIQFDDSCSSKTCQPKDDIEILSKIIQIGSINEQNQIKKFLLYWPLIECRLRLCLKELFIEILMDDPTVQTSSTSLITRLQYEYSKPKLKQHLIQLLIELYSFTNYSHIIRNYQLSKQCIQVVPRVCSIKPIQAKIETISSPIRITVNGTCLSPSCSKIVNVNICDLYNPSHRTVLRINDVTHPIIVDNNNIDCIPHTNRLLKLSNPLNQNFLARFIPTNGGGEDNNVNVKRSNKTQSNNNKWNSHENNIDNGNGYKNGKNKYNDSTFSTLLGSLRTKSKDKQQQHANNIRTPKKFQTISNIGHRTGKHTSVNKSNSIDPQARYRSLEKVSSLELPQNKSNSSTWENIYVRFLSSNPLSRFSMFRFKSNRNKNSSSSSSSSSSSTNTEQKSFSEPNLSWKKNKINKCQSSSVANVNQYHTDDNSVSTPSQLFRISAAVNNRNVDNCKKCDEYSRHWTGSLDKKTYKPQSSWNGDKHLAPENNSSNDTSWCDLHGNNKQESKESNANLKLRRSRSGSYESSNTSTLSMLFKTNSIKNRHLNSNKDQSKSSHLKSTLMDQCCYNEQCPDNPLNGNHSLGEISLSMEYFDQYLQVDIYECRFWQLAKNKVDLYVKVHLLPDLIKCNKRKTKARRATRLLTKTGAALHELSFNEKLVFVGDWYQFDCHTLMVAVWSQDTFSPNCVCAQTTIELSKQSMDTFKCPKWYTLMPPLQIVSSMFSVTGSLFLALKYETEDLSTDNNDNGTLHVLIKEAQSLNITPTQTNGSVLCKLLLLPETSKEDRIKCDPIQISSNPKWNQTMLFNTLTQNDLKCRQLEISVWCYCNKSTKNIKTCLGGIRLSSHDKDCSSQETSLWNQLFERHNMWVYGELALRPI